MCIDVLCEVKPVPLSWFRRIGQSFSGVYSKRLDICQPLSSIPSRVWLQTQPSGESDLPRFRPYRNPTTRKRLKEGTLGYSMGERHGVKLIRAGGFLLQRVSTGKLDRDIVALRATHCAELHHTHVDTIPHVFKCSYFPCVKLCCCISKA